MKQLILCLSLVMLLSVSCKKTSQVPQKTSNNTSITSLGAYSGTFINSTNINDQFTLTKCSNALNGSCRYVISNHYNYNTYSTNHDTLLESELTTYPYYEAVYINSGVTYSSQLYASSTTVLKIQYQNQTGGPITTLTFNRQ